MNDSLVIHLTQPYYCDHCDQTFSGYTAHYCEALTPQGIAVETVEPPTWIKQGDHT